MHKLSFKSFLRSRTGGPHYPSSSMPLFSRVNQMDRLEHDLLDCPWPELLYRKVLLSLVGVLAVVVLLMRVF